MPTTITLTIEIPDGNDDPAKPYVDGARDLHSQAATAGHAATLDVRITRTKDDKKRRQIGFAPRAVEGCNNCTPQNHSEGCSNCTPARGETIAPLKPVDNSKSAKSRGANDCI